MQRKLSDTFGYFHSSAQFYWLEINRIVSSCVLVQLESLWTDRIFKLIACQLIQRKKLVLIKARDALPALSSERTRSPCQALDFWALLAPERLVNYLIGLCRLFFSFVPKNWRHSECFQIGTLKLAFFQIRMPISLSLSRLSKSQRKKFTRRAN